MTTTTTVIDLCPKPPETADEIFDGVERPDMNAASLLNEMEELQIIEKDKGRNIYHEGKVPVTLGFLRRYMLEFPEKYIYNKELADYILGLVKVPESMHRLVETAVYLAQREKGKLLKALRVRNFLADGYMEISNFPCKQGMKVIAQVANPNASEYAFSEVEGTLKEIPEQGWWLMRPRARNTGYPASRHEMYVKQITKFS